MQATQFLSATGGNWNRAKVLEQLLYWVRTTNIRDEHDRPVMLPNFRKMGEHLRCNKSAISRAVDWLEENGFIRTQYVKVRNQTRRQIRLLIRLKSNAPQRSATVAATLAATHNTLSIPSESPVPTSAEPSGSGVVAMALKGKVSGVADRLKQAKADAHAREADAPLRPRSAALVWRRLLAEYGYPTISIEDPKVLSAIGKTIAIFEVDTLAAFKTELERRISMWQSVRPKRLYKTPPHPWPLNRCAPLFEPDELAFTETAPDLENPTVEKAIDLSAKTATPTTPPSESPVQPQPPVIQKQKTLMELLADKAKKKGKGT